MNPTANPSPVCIKTERGVVVEDLVNTIGSIGSVGTIGTIGIVGSAAAAGTDKKPFVCAKCSQVIKDKYYMQVMDRCWHDHCLRCDYCSCQLGDAYNQSLYTRDNRVMCKTDYMR